MPGELPLQIVVAVERDEVFEPIPDRVVERVDQALAVALVDRVPEDPQAAHVVLEPAEYLRRPVGRAVVDHHQLPVAEPLAQHRLDRFGKGIQTRTKGLGF